MGNKNASGSNDDATSSVKITKPLQEKEILVKFLGNFKSCGTNGKETIHNMVEREVNKLRRQRKPNVQYMFFKRMSDDACLNIGAPTGVLQKGEKYECIFKSRIKNKTTDKMRSYHAQQFDEKWGIQSFYVKLGDVGFAVSSFQRIKGIGKLLVDFIPGETLYEALFRDGRFDISTKDGLVIRKCYFLNDDDVEISLSAQASNHAQEVLRFKKSKAIDDELDAEVSPLLEPPIQADGYSIPIKKECTTSVEGNTEFPPMPVASSTPTPKIARNLQTFEYLVLYLKEKFGLQLTTGETNKDNQDRHKEIMKENEKVFKKHYENFALNFQHRVYLSDLEDTLRMKSSIGAIIYENFSKVSKCGATCFRIGTKYVITNNHVLDCIKKMKIPLSSCHVDFNYEEKGQAGYYVHFAANPVIVSSNELDYAILELNPESNQLPPSLIDPEVGLNIAPHGRQLLGGECLSFIGHPGGLKKQVNVSCPIKHQDDIQEHLVLALQLQRNTPEFEAHEYEVLKATGNPDSAVYDVSTFFKGSSGSPGFLLEEKLLMVLHARGVPFKGQKKCFALEEGILMSSIVNDVIDKIRSNEIEGKVEKIFSEMTAKNFFPEDMDID